MRAVALVVLCSCGGIETTDIPDAAVAPPELPACNEARATTFTSLDPDAGPCKPVAEADVSMRTTCTPNWRAHAGEPLVLHVAPLCGDVSCFDAMHRDVRRYTCTVHVTCGEHPRIELTMHETFCANAVCDDACDPRRYPCNVPPLQPGAYTIVDPSDASVSIWAANESELTSTTCP